MFGKYQAWREPFEMSIDFSDTYALRQLLTDGFLQLPGALTVQSSWNRVPSRDGCRVEPFVQL